MPDENKIRDAADAVKGIVETVPVYQDTLQPAAREIGTGLATVAKTIHVALAPIAALVWGYDTIKEFVTTRVAEKLSAVPTERIITPEVHVVGPALEALRYTGHQHELRELYANLLATSLDADTCSNAHPAFVDIIKNMSPDEAKIMQQFAQRYLWPVLHINAQQTETTRFSRITRNFCLVGEVGNIDHRDLTPTYLENLHRLGLIRLPGLDESFCLHDDSYLDLEASEEVQETLAELNRAVKLAPEMNRGIVRITQLGKQFCDACVACQSKEI